MNRLRLKSASKFAPDALFLRARLIGIRWVAAKSRRFAYSCIILFSACLANCTTYVSEKPRYERLQSDQIQRRIEVAKSNSSTFHFGISGVAFSGSTLFATSNVGVIEFDGPVPKALDSWHSSAAAYSGPWATDGGRTVWIQRRSDYGLSRHDADGWHETELPPPPTGYLDRGDLIAGHQVVETPRGARLIGGGYVWAWKEGAGWILETSPPVVSIRDYSVAVGYLGDRELRVSGDGYHCGPIGNCKYYVWERTGSSWRNQGIIPLDNVGRVVQSTSGIFVLEIKGGGFLPHSPLTFQGALFQLTETGPKQILTPGPCEAIALASNGELVASFTNLGVFSRRNDDWVKLLSSPYEANEGEHVASLAEHDGVLALATESLVKFTGYKNEKEMRTGSDALWLSSEGSWIQVSKIGLTSR